MNRAVIMWIHLRLISMKRELVTIVSALIFINHQDLNQTFKIRQVIEFHKTESQNLLYKV